MKRAKEYAKRYRDEPTDETMVEIAVAFLAEVAELAKTRLGKHPSYGAVRATFDEQDRKWRTFAENFPGIIRPDGFELLLKKREPEAYILWRGLLVESVKKREMRRRKEKQA